MFFAILTNLFLNSYGIHGDFWKCISSYSPSDKRRCNFDEALGPFFFKLVKNSEVLKCFKISLRNNLDEPFLSQSLGFQSNLTPKKPALPPKQKQKINSSNASLNNIVTPPVSPKLSNDNVFMATRNETIPKENKNLVHENNEKKINNCENEKPEAVVLRRKPTETVIKIIFCLIRNLTET